MKCLCRISVLILVAVLLSGCGQKPEPTEPSQTAEVTVCEAKPEIRMVLPDPEVFFFGDKVARNAPGDNTFYLSFDEYPQEAADAFCRLLCEGYGLQQSSTGESRSTMYDLPGAVYFLDPETGETCVQIVWAEAHPAAKVLVILYADFCGAEAGEIWDGEIGRYQYDPADWTVCGTCEGSGKCFNCHGEGRIRVSDYDDWDYEDCPVCRRGECKNEACVNGRVRVRK